MWQQPIIPYALRLLHRIMRADHLSGRVMIPLRRAGSATRRRLLGMPSSRIVPVGILATTVVLTGCGGLIPGERSPVIVSAGAGAESPSAGEGAEGTTGPPTDGPTAGDATPGDPSSAAAAPPPGGRPRRTAPPGTTLVFGRPAVVKATTANRSGQLTITITGITKGRPADLAPLDLDDQVEGRTPYYLRFTVTNSGTADFSFSSFDSGFGAQLADGSPAEPIYVVGRFPPCAATDVGRNFVHGHVAKGCKPFLAGAGTSITRGTFKGLDDGAGQYALNPIVWSR